MFSLYGSKFHRRRIFFLIIGCPQQKDLDQHSAIEFHLYNHDLSIWHVNEGTSNHFHGATGLLIIRIALFKIRKGLLHGYGNSVILKRGSFDQTIEKDWVKLPIGYVG